MDDERFTAQQKDVLRKLAITSRHSNHPYERDPLFTVGWVRICRDDANGVWLVEEVQSDIHIVRHIVRGKKNSEQRYSFSEADLVEVMEVMQPYIDRFYADALGITLIEAEKLGYEVEMLDHVTKMRQGFIGTDEHGRTVSAAKPLYRDLPASMGINAKRKSRVLPDLREDVRWTRPNTSKRNKPKATYTHADVRRVLRETDGTGDPEWLEHLYAQVKPYKTWALVMLDPGTLDNPCTDYATAREYAEGIEDAPPIVVVPDGTGQLTIIDGGHRALAAALVGAKIRALVPVS
jgi:hypothetical protein